MRIEKLDPPPGRRYYDFLTDIEFGAPPPGDLEVLELAGGDCAPSAGNGGVVGDDLGADTRDLPNLAAPDRRAESVEGGRQYGDPRPWTSSLHGGIRRGGVGVATGRYFWILDVDVRSGGRAALDLLELVNGVLPITPRTSTPSGGEHIWFAADGRISNETGSLPAGLDFRGFGGQTILPPAPGREWIVGPWDAPFVPAPSWLLKMILEPWTQGDTRAREHTDEETGELLVPSGAGTTSSRDSSVGCEHGDSAASSCTRRVKHS